MRFFILVLALGFSNHVLADIIPWQVKCKLSLGLESNKVFEQEEHFDVGIELSQRFRLLKRSWFANAEWKLKYRYEGYNTKEAKDAYIYRAEFNIYL